MDHNTISLTSHQLTLLGHLTAALTTMPEEHRLHHAQLRRVGATWIFHDGFYDDVRVANWDDVLALQDFGLIHLQLDDDPDDCTCVITELAQQVSAQMEAVPRQRHGGTLSFDVQPLQSD
jgi:hypothetical protein